VSAPESTAEAVRWLRRSYRAGALVDALAAVGMAHPKLFGPTLRFDPEYRRAGPEFTYAMRAAGLPMFDSVVWRSVLPADGGWLGMGLLVRARFGRRQVSRFA
jgi:hypothetical protein